jgi:hypothetical protein
MMPPPPSSNAPPKTTLTENEMTFILRTTLLPEHQHDPNVLAFIMSYLRCRSTAQAAKEIGLEPRSGYNLKNRPDIHLAIVKLTEKSLLKYGYDATEIVERVKEIAALDPIELERPDGSYKNKMSEIAPETRRAIKKFKVKNIFGEDPNGMKTVVGEIIEVEFWDKMKSIELLGREKEIFKDTTVVQHDVTSNMASLLLESRERAERRLNSMEPIQIEARKPNEDT